jgi:hypothetical protein
MTPDAKRALATTIRALRTGPPKSLIEFTDVTNTSRIPVTFSSDCTPC